MRRPAINLLRRAHIDQGYVLGEFEEGIVTGQGGHGARDEEEPQGQEKEETSQKKKKTRRSRKGSRENRIAAQIAHEACGQKTKEETRG
jgi:hypothetical protein